MARNVVLYKQTTGKKIERRVREHNHNFLKYWRIVRYWAKRKYEISNNDLEVILYLYDVELFTHAQFLEFTGLLNWDRERFSYFLDKGYIVQWRKIHGQARLYTLSIGAKRICSSVYKKLTQEEKIPENKVNNPIFRGDAYMDKVYRTAIRRMNRERDRKEKEERDRELGI